VLASEWVMTEKGKYLLIRRIGVGEVNFDRKMGGGRGERSRGVAYVKDTGMRKSGNGDISRLKMNETDDKKRRSKCGRGDT